MALFASTLAGAALPAGAQTNGDRSAKCTDGTAYRPELDGHPILESGAFPCDDVDLLSYFTNDEIGGGLVAPEGRGSDVWGWTDPVTGAEYVIAGLEVGTSFIDISDPRNPVYLAHLPSSATNNLIWHDIKVYNNHAFIVSESNNHGMQVFDLTRLRGLNRAAAPHMVTMDAHYTGFGRAHNIYINEDSGYAYAVGQREDVTACAGGMHGGMHIIDIRNPTNPTWAGCYSQDYVHDVHCVMYDGPDSRYTGREICIASTGGNGQVAVIDVTNHANPVELARTTYPNPGYSHQGWLLDGHRYFLHNTESTSRVPQGVDIFDMASLTSPQHIGFFQNPAQSTHHNMYQNGRFVYQSNYSSGLRIYDTKDVAQGTLQEVGYFDVYPPHDNPGFGLGTWSNYSWFESGVVAIHGYQGLFIVDPRMPSADVLESDLDDLVDAGGITAGLEAKIRNAIAKYEEWSANPRQARIAHTHLQRAIHLLLWQADVIENKNKPNQGDADALRALAALFQQALDDDQGRP